jgi:hypothetical protein
MPDLDSVRTLYPERPRTSDQARGRARLVLIEHIDRGSQRGAGARWPRRLTLVGVSLAAAATAVLIALVGVGNEPRIAESSTSGRSTRISPPTRSAAMPCSSRMFGSSGSARTAVA